MKKSKIIFIVLGMLIVIILSSSLIYYFLKIKPPSENSQANVTVIINYGSLKVDNYEEYNVSTISGSSALHVFSIVAELDTINFSMGVYIRGVNGYMEELPNYWSFLYFDIDTQLWIYSGVGVDKYFVSDGDKIKLEYTG